MARYDDQGRPYGSGYHDSRPHGYEERETRTEVTTRVRGNLAGAATPENVTIKPERVGDAMRGKTIAHLEEMAARGYLTEDELGNRLAHARKAETKEELAVLIADLPTGAPERASDKDRNRVTDHLAEMHALGHLSDDELEKRRNAALAAVTRDELSHLTSDLPPLPVRHRNRPRPDQPKSLKERMMQDVPQTWMAIITIFVLGLAMIVCPWFALGGNIGHMIASLLVIIGIATVVFGVVWVVNVEE